MARAKLLPLMRACIAVAESTGRPVEQAVAPNCPKPYIVVTSVSSPRYSGPLSDTEADGMDRIQFSCVGETAEQSDWLRDQVRGVLTVDALDAAFGVLSEPRRTLRCILDIPRGVQRDDRGLPAPIFVSIDQYMIETTPTA